MFMMFHDVLFACDQPGHVHRTNEILSLSTLSPASTLHRPASSPRLPGSGTLTDPVPFSHGATAAAAADVRSRPEPSSCGTEAAVAGDQRPCPSEPRVLKCGVIDTQVRWVRLEVRRVRLEVRWMWQRVSMGDHPFCCHGPTLHIAKKNCIGSARCILSCIPVALRIVQT